jgi:sirohydrochlorin ferrochelatase
MPLAPITAVLLAAHGDGGEDGRNEAIQTVAELLRRRIDLPVAWAVIKRPETFAAAREALGHAAEGTVAVYPFFMTDGWFVRTKLPKLVAEAGFGETVRLAPFGTDPKLVDLIERRLRRLASMEGGRSPRDLRIVMVAHGSGAGHRESRLGAEAVAAALGARGLGTIHLGFIEEDPFFDAVIGRLEPDIVIGFFASEGTHALDDVRTLVLESPFVRHHVTAIGMDLEAAGLVAEAVEDCISRETA